MSEYPAPGPGPEAEIIRARLSGLRSPGGLTGVGMFTPVRVWEQQVSPSTYMVDFDVAQTVSRFQEVARAAMRERNWPALEPRPDHPEELVRREPVLVRLSSGALAAVAMTSNGLEIIEQRKNLDAAVLHNALLSAFIRPVRRVQVPGGPPGTTVQQDAAHLPSQYVDILLVSLGRDEVPELRGLVSAPLISPTRIRWQAGYDIDTKMWVLPDAERMGMEDEWRLWVSTVGTHEESRESAEEAAQRLLSYFSVFRYGSGMEGAGDDGGDVGPGGAIDALGVALTPWLVDLLPEGAPMPMITIGARQPGSGKTQLARTIMKVGGLTLSGREYASGTFDGEAGDKLLDVMALVGSTGARGLLLDNVSRKLGGDALESVLTDRWYTTRLKYGRSSMKMRWDAMIVATLNSPMISEDMERRCFPIALVKGDVDTKAIDDAMDRLDEAVGDFSLAMDVTKLLSHWISMGMPAGRGDGAERMAKGSYKEWADAVGGILECAGLSGWGERREGILSQLVVSEADHISDDLAALAFFLVPGACKSDELDHPMDAVRARLASEGKLKVEHNPGGVENSGQVWFTVSTLMDLLASDEVSGILSYNPRTHNALHTLTDGWTGRSKLPSARWWGMRLGWLCKDLPMPVYGAHTLSWEDGWTLQLKKNGPVKVMGRMGRWICLRWQQCVDSGSGSGSGSATGTETGTGTG